MLLLLELVPKWVWLALIAALSATSCTLKLKNGELTIEIEKGKTYVAQLESNIAKANADAATKSAEMGAKAREAEQARVAREQAILADADGAKSELERLRAVVASTRSAYALRAPAGALATSLDYPDPFPDLFLACTERYIDMARIADGHANDAKTLIDAWPK